MWEWLAQNSRDETKYCNILPLPLTLASSQEDRSPLHRLLSRGRAHGVVSGSGSGRGEITWLGVQRTEEPPWPWHDLAAIIQIYNYTYCNVSYKKKRHIHLINNSTGLINGWWWHLMYVCLRLNYCDLQIIGNDHMIVHVNVRKYR